MIVSDFIQKYLIDRIESLIDDYPFESFILMSIGIEFLGKCLNNNPWDDWKMKKPSDTFDDAIKSYPTLTKYTSIPFLYHNLRCGLAHRFMVKGNINLCPDKNDLTNTIITIGCKELYADFRRACLDAINNKNGMIKKNMAEEYDIEIDSVTGSTQTANMTVT